MHSLAAEPPLLTQVQQQWGIANYQLQGDAQINAFEALIAKMDTHLMTAPGDSDIWVWNGIVKSSLAGAKGGLGALPLAKQAKRSLEQALQLNPQALNGSAYTSLATLYHKVPGWPLGFGNDKTAAELFAKALLINPKGIDPNYFYGEYLYDEGYYKKAQQHLMLAKHAAPRADRPVADQGRQQEIATLLQKVEKKLK
jgi:tetratricopeptide (TPR) repeat protein